MAGRIVRMFTIRVHKLSIDRCGQSCFTPRVPPGAIPSCLVFLMRVMERITLVYQCDACATLAYNKFQDI